MLESPTGKPITLGAAHPNAGLEVQYRRKLVRLVDEMNRSILYWIRVYYRRDPPEIAQDSPASTLIKAIRGLGRRWTRRFNDTADELAAYFGTAIRKRSEAALQDILRRGGFSVRFRPSAAVRDVMDAIVAGNVSLIRSIPAQHFTQIEGMVMRSVQAGRDLKQLTDDLQDAFGVTRRRAIAIARDQNNKATAMITRARQMEIGVTKAIWLHSHGGNPRPEHLSWSGQEYDVAKGMWSKVDHAWVWPGTAINCRCVSKSIVPGYSA
jgi:SPP1 gp7 family putative phage head morphogenesis protein